MINYELLYTDFVTESVHFSEQEKAEMLKELTGNGKERITYKTLLRLNGIIARKVRREHLQSKYATQLKAYDRPFIQSVLKYQKKYGLTNSDISKQFKISRNTVNRWKKVFGSGTK